MTHSGPTRSPATTGPDADLVIRVHDRDQVTALHVRHRPLGHQQRVLFRVQDCPHPDEHARNQQPLGVGELAHDRDGPGLDVHLVVREEDPPFRG